MARVTIIVDDRVVGVDGVFRHVNMSSMPDDIHAVQWYGGSGEIEYRSNAPNKQIDDFGPFRKFLDAWRAAEPK